MHHKPFIAHKKKSWTHSPVLAVFLVVVLCWGLFVVYRMYVKNREAVALRNQFQSELDTLNEKQEELADKITHLSTDRGLEAEVRNRYRVIRPGEQLVIVVDDAAQSNKTPSVNPSWWVRIKQFLGF
ncbi:MAG: septum formation initiator family protein [bacterium]